MVRNNGFSTEQIIKIKEQLTKKLKEKDRLIKPKHGNLHLLWGIHEERHKRIQEQHNKNNIQDNKQYIQTIGIWKTNKWKIKWHIQTHM